MEVTEEDTGSQLKDIQIACSWIPATPAKPDLAKQQPICTNWQENYIPDNVVTQANLSESGPLPGDFQQETQSQTIPACYDSTNLFNVSSGSNIWRADEAKKSHISGDNLSNFDTWHEVEVVNSYVFGEDLSAGDKFPKLCNMSFQNLLALAHAGGNRAAVDDALAHTDFVATSSTSVPRFHPQIGGSQLTLSFGDSPLQDLDSLPGAKFDTELNIQNVLRIDGSSIPSRPFFDLNSSPRTTDAASSKSASSFEPITPEKTNKAEQRQDSAIKVLSIDEVPANRDTQENKIAKDGALELHETKEKSHLVIDQLCAPTSTQLPENHKPDKGGTEEVLLIKTPQQKPRRKKHRPKVIIEGQQKSSTKSSVGKPNVPQETPKVKRRYVRRKGVNNPLGGETNGTDLNNKTPSSMDSPTRKRKYVRRKETDNPESDMDLGITETTGIKSPGRTQGSCRRSLNFNSVGQAGDECSSYHPSSICDMELKAENFNEKDQRRILHSKGGMKVVMEKLDTVIFHELTHSTNPEADFPAGSQQHTPNMDQLRDDQNIFTDHITCSRGKCQIVFSDVTQDKDANIVQVRMNSDCQRMQSLIGSNCSSTCLTPETQVRGLKRQNTSTSVDAELPNRNEIGAFYNSLQAYLPIFSRNAAKNDATPGLHFPVIYKKKRTEKGQSMVTSSSQYAESTSDNHVKHALRDSCSKLFIATTNQGSSGVQCQVSNLLSTNTTPDGAQNGRQIFEDLLALGPTEKVKKRRSKGNTRLRDLASLLEICKELPASPSRAAASRIKKNAEILHEPHTCMEALVAATRSTMTTKKRSRRGPLINSSVQKMFNHQMSATISIGNQLALTWKSMSPIDSLIEQLNQLDINAESSHALAQYQNAFISFHTQYQEQSLVPFQRCQDVVPFDNSFAQVRRRKPRPKVDLDDETTRVWKLLLENINSEGIDGTDEEKTKWWEEERRVFCGRADSFIARMRLVQGDRRFSPWKGSVVDSVVGVFLTQNVSDHLSSSAFMSLAAQFPIKSKTDSAQLHEERLGNNKEELEVFVLDPDEPFGLNKDILNQSVCGENTKVLQDFEDDSIQELNSVKSSGNSFDRFILKDNLGGQSSDTIIHGPVVSHETVTKKSTSLIDNGRDAEETLSSQTPDISPQNSADSPVAQITERSDSCLPSTSEEESAAGVKRDRIASTSFVKLLQMAGTVLQIDYKKGSESKMSDQSQQMLSESSAIKIQNEGHLGNPTFPAKTITSCHKSTSCHVPNLGAQATQCDLSQENTKLFEKELCTAETSELSSESESTSFQKIPSVSFIEEPKSSSPSAHSSNNDQIGIHHKRVSNQTSQASELSLVQEKNYKMQEVLQIPIYPPNLMDITGSSSNIDNLKNLEHKEVNSKNEPDKHSGKMVNGPKAKGGRTRKEKGEPDDWDNLRKQAHASGRERARTANTVDSVDWDAVRCADVNEIAQTIKERGMNNMLAERIKDFLNRLVRDHGSIDLEWLRDVPPDKAKEYLLSFRGLGLKSVECVRLLTLHHLAFPVDTNVGRIAVRLGWVPLQPLPESLQLHLLELYPVLESIQKYLWPRLCKLDQRTLYELHYQMITFGKVFCTKSKPNCNACPLRAECRHFASAFASARLALPAPDEKSIVSATENRPADENPISMNTLQLPSPEANQMDITCGASRSQPIIEEPPSPEPTIEVPATPEPGYTQVSECNIESLNEDPDEIPTIQLNMEEFTHNLQKIMQQNTELQESDMSKALVALTSDAASIPVPKLKNVSRLRTEHRVYELPDSHPLLEGLDKREPDDPCPYLLAIWTPGETVNSIEPPEKRCSSQGSENLCTDETCSSCNSIREANSQTVRGTLLIPCRTAMRGSFPLNGTYFQVNEVFSDHESSLSPMDVPREWLWNLRRRTVFFGTSIPTIFKGLSTEGIQYCFWRGFVCVRGFDRKTRAPRPLTARLHFPGSKLAKGKGKEKIYENE